jgi:isoleucyl-tRNA synthetase
MFAETIYSYLRTEKDPISIHLTDYPKPVKMDDLVIKEMDTARKIVEAGLSKRASAGIKVRQPLSKLTYNGSKLDSELETIIAEEVNVKSVENDSKITEVIIDTEISPELKMEGTAREIIRNIQSLRKKTGFEVEDRIGMVYQTESKFLADTLEKFEEVISKEILAKSIKSGKLKSEGTEEFTIDGEKIQIGINKNN